VIVKIQNTVTFDAAMFRFAGAYNALTTNTRISVRTNPEIIVPSTESSGFIVMSLIVPEVMANI